jgi:putative Mg2+ transporter-C (MgtC) family protein
VPVALRWQEIAVRLALTVLAGALIGINRGEHGRAAGLRTTLLVCMAASVSMIQANLLLGTAGKEPNSFVTLDLMRLPLGILSGMGFIGAGAILRRGNMVMGVTTAATLWFATVIGLCFGGGQNELGLAGVALGMIVLWGLKSVEQRIRQHLRGAFVINLAANGPSEKETREIIQNGGCRLIAWGVAYTPPHERRIFRGEVALMDRRDNTEAPEFITHLAQRPGVINVSWEPHWRP